MIIPFAGILCSCSASIDGVVREGGAAGITLKTSLEPRTTALIRSLKGFMGEAPGASILDGPAMGRSLAAAPGIQSAALKNSSPSALEGTIAISNAGDFLAAAGADSGAKSRFVTYLEGQSAGASSIKINLDRASAPELISRLSPEIEDYLSALMAPAVTGEAISTREYLDLLAMVYSRPLADEVAVARVRASIEFPRPVTEVSGGTAAGKKAEFNIPLTDLLVLEKPLSYTVKW